MAIISQFVLARKFSCVTLPVGSLRSLRTSSRLRVTLLRSGWQGACKKVGGSFEWLSCMLGAATLRLVGFLCLALVLVGVAVAAGVAFTPALCSVAAFLSAVILVIAEGVRRLFVKPSGPDKKTD